MRYTLLEIVQDILNDMDSDNVNSINDTVEAQQVAQIVKTCYNEQISNRNWPHLQKLIQLEASGDIAKPNYLRIPLGLKELRFFKYDTHRTGQSGTMMNEVRYKDPESFLRLVSNRGNQQHVDVVFDPSGTQLMIANNQPPTYWTSFDDDYIVTDSYDKQLDDTLKKAKTQCLAYVEPVWVHTDDAIPDLPDEAFAGLIEEAKSTAFAAIKQTANQKAEQKAARQSRWLSRKAWATHGGIDYPNYGRKGRR